MGDPRKLKKKYSSPTHPWQKARIDEEVTLIKGYGYRRKTEIWKVRSELGRYRTQARKLIGVKTKQSEKEKKELLTKLNKLGLIGKDASLDDVLGLTIREISERRLQTLVLKKKLANSLRQARQFITHKHITVGGKVITSPNYFVSVDEEANIAFTPTSDLSNTNHPLRVQQMEAEKKQRVIEKEEVKEQPEETKEEAKEEPAKEAEGEEAA